MSCSRCLLMSQMSLISLICTFHIALLSIRHLLLHWLCWQKSPGSLVSLLQFWFRCFEFLRIDPPESELRLADFFVVSWFTAGNGTQLPMKPIYIISRSLLFELCIVRTLVIRLIGAVQTIIYLWHSILAFNFRPIRDLQKKSTKFKFRTRKKVQFHYICMTKPSHFLASFLKSWHHIFVTKLRLCGINVWWNFLSIIFKKVL